MTRPRRMRVLEREGLEERAKERARARAGAVLLALFRVGALSLRDAPHWRELVASLDELPSNLESLAAGLRE